MDLIDRLKNIIPNGSKFISFDVSSLFTNVPLGPTLDFLKRKLSNCDHVFPIDVNCILDLIELCTQNLYFEFNDIFYEQIFGMAMGNPLSPILANLFLEHVESELIPPFVGISPTLWVRYVDDILCLIPFNFDTNVFLDFINNLYPSLKFTSEYETNGSIPFLDVLIHNCNTFLKFSVYRKPTNSESYLHFYSFNSLNIKISLAQGLFLRALRICSREYLNNEFLHIKKSLIKLAYPSDILDKALTNAKRTHFSNKDRIKNDIDFKNTVIVPYVPHLEQFKPLLRSINKNMIFKYNEKLANKLTKNKLSSKPLESGVYKIDCRECNKIYIGESGRSFHIRMKEHKHDIVINKPMSAVSSHVHETGHGFNFDNAKLIFPCTDLSKRHIVESSMIKHYGDRCVNLNNGFVALDDYTNNFISKNVISNLPP